MPIITKIRTVATTTTKKWERVIVWHHLNQKPQSSGLVIISKLLTTSIDMSEAQEEKKEHVSIFSPSIHLKDRIKN